MLRPAGIITLPWCCLSHVDVGSPFPIRLGASQDLACHWRHPVADYPLTGDEVHGALRERALTLTVEHIERDFVLGVYRADARSVAERTGLA